MPITEIANAPVVEVAPYATAEDAVRLMAHHHVGALVVTRENELVGMVTDRDITTAVVAEGRSLATTAVAEIMSPEPAFVRDHSGIMEVIQAMRRSKARRLPVVDEHLHPIAIVAADDLLLYLAKEIAYLGRAFSRGWEVERATKDAPG
ncbi:MAG: histidine kinase [Nitrospirae bacterium CG18_big_fil_WC_8_21_14_2_50_70_55]|nr:CBS domain-containing protein [Deltaproteobacteria bacterium]OIP64175.1 MAG: hypothetical protein AUK30_07125 [Nitrospirae bacterium CG2_30_70_394]PIQ06630.1 MAG: histidine kinase [Nitrospirae bacterium CG18_big_fil_WC_8_21_14_2_50_70_55]PIU78411.1 MAG: CBS domain-containing protein [Nitrospirae bacterium CG06_land_8_20_14_3_00_70_43]PIW84025.1 MAG: CBS domain-containing protein [Nitrospirae bacterium CG_4_8_14_3_um_filter_70_85]PIX83603.1 MAG: CBS domain-containing protein [Nitrospirae bac